MSKEEVKKQTEEEWEDVSENSAEEEEEKDTTINNGDVVMKYKKAANFANDAIREVVKACVPGARVAELCVASDALIKKKLDSVFKGMEKGTAFPTCISINDVVCHFSPDADDTTTMKEGDMVRVDLGVQIDGYPAVVAHTVVCGGAAPTGRQADVMNAAATAVNTAIRKFRPGTELYDITATLEAVAQEFGVNCVEGVLSHEMKRYIVDGSHCVPGKDVAEHKVWNYEVGPAQVWTLDVVMTTGAGKLKEIDYKTNVFKQTLEANYQLKLAAAREVFHEISKTYQTFPFAVRQLESKKARLGLSEALKHQVIQPFSVLQEKEGEHVAHYKVTLLVTNSKIERITGLPLPKVEQQLKGEALIEASKLPMAFAKKDKK